MKRRASPEACNFYHAAINTPRIVNMSHPRISVITVSDRCARGERTDVSGPLAAELLRPYGEVNAPVVVPDGIATVQEALRAAVAGGADVVLTTGGTGITTRDLTPEATIALLAARLSGIESLLRANPRVPTAALSRGVAGIMEQAGRRAFVVNAPGSTGGVRDAVAIIGPLLTHIAAGLTDVKTTAPHPPREETATLAAHQRRDWAEHELRQDAHAKATWKAQHRGIPEHGDATVVHAEVVEVPIDMRQLDDAVADPTAGAVATFCGRVRNHDEARAVVSIHYEAHPDANAVIRRVAQEVAERSGACRIAVQHRVGLLEVGDAALGAAVSASHRRDAFQALEQLIEAVKLQLPVWKKQEFTDGTHAWSGSA